MSSQKIFIAILCPIPAFILDKGIIATEIYSHWTTALWTVWNQFCWNTHIFLFLQHPTNQFLIFIRFLVTWFAALQQPIVSLGIKQPLFVKSSFLETVIYIGGNHKIILILHQTKQIFIDRIRYIHIAVVKDMAAPPRPVFFQCLIWIKSATVYVANSILFLKI